MIITRVVFLTAAVVSCGSASAQTDQAAPTSRASAVVNKCVGADGSVIFSDAPCPNKTKEQKVDTSAALRTGSGGHTGEIAASVADSDCRARAKQTASGTDTSKIDESNRHIADYQQRQQRLSERKAYATDGSGALVDDPLAQQEIAQLNDAIAKEREYQQGLQSHSDAAYASALKDCEAQAPKNIQPKPTP